MRNLRLNNSSEVTLFAPFRRWQSQIQTQTVLLLITTSGLLPLLPLKIKDLLHLGEG